MIWIVLSHGTGGVGRQLAQTNNVPHPARAAYLSGSRFGPIVRTGSAAKFSIEYSIDALPGNSQHFV
jgi:hypothetical protein